VEGAASEVRHRCRYKQCQHGDRSIGRADRISEIIPPAVFTQATSFKSRSDGLLKTTQEEFDWCKDLYVAECEAKANDTADANVSNQLTPVN
jgi:hypothetical protein